MALESGPKINIKIIQQVGTVWYLFFHHVPQFYRTIQLYDRFAARYPPLCYNIKPMWVPLIPARDFAANASGSDEMIVFDDDK